MKLPVLSIFLFFIYNTIAQHSIVINEVVSKNSAGIVDADGEYHDWIELYNKGDVAINLMGYGISDDVTQPFKFIFPKVIIHPKSHLLIFASDKAGSNNEIHLNFKLNENGEQIVLTNPEGIRLDDWQPVSLAENTSWGRAIDGGAKCIHFLTPSANQPNVSAAGIVFSKEQGFYEQSFSLELKSNTNAEIRYTLDGSIPNINSMPYEHELLIAHLMSDSSALGYRKTAISTPTINKNYLKGTVVRAATFEDGKRTSFVYTKSYFICPKGRGRYKNIDVVSLVTDQHNLFDPDTGIYVLGKSGEQVVEDANFYKRGKLWERMAHVSFFDSLGSIGFEQDIGIRIHGGKGRQNPQKSIRLCADEKYGANSINYPLFEMRSHRVFKTVVLRNSMSCWEKTIVKDELTAEVCKNLKVDVLAYRPVIVFINGEFWGIHSIREFFDEEYIAANYGVDKEEVNIVLNGYGNYEAKDSDWGMLKGDGRTHIEMYQFLKSHSLNDSVNFIRMKRYLDMESIIDYYCTQIFFNNRDWPTNNNKLWSIGNGPWHQIMYDMDAGWSRSFDDNVIRLIGGSEQNRTHNRPYSRFLFKKLLESSIFIDAFIKRMAFLIQNDFSARRIFPLLEKAKATYSNFIEEHHNRWGNALSYNKWNGVFFILDKFVKQRSKKLEQVFLKHFNRSLLKV